MMTINSGSKIPRRKRVAHFSSSQSKVRVIEDVMAKGLERMSLDHQDIQRTVERIENHQEWIEALPERLEFSAPLEEYLKRTATNSMIRTYISRIPRPKVSSNCMTVALWKPRPPILMGPVKPEPEMPSELSGLSQTIEVANGMEAMDTN